MIPQAEQSKPFRVLIVEDEPGWESNMRIALEYAADDRKQVQPECVRPKCESALDTAAACRLLALEHFDLLSLDIRLPETDGSSVTVFAGIRLARASLFYSATKTIIFSSTLVQESAVGISADGAVVLAEAPQIIDKYAKSSGAPPVPTARFETLSQRQWAERVLDYLYHDGLYLPSADPKRKLETALGAWLSGAVRSLPPLLARHAQALQNHWPEPGRKVDARAVDAALKLIESVLRLAVAQTAVLLGDRQQLPADTTQDAAIRCLRTLINNPALRDCSWRAHLDDAALTAFDQARQLRNTARHSLRSNNTSGEWQDLRPCLRYAMDVATYWAKHPLCTDLRYGVDGWRGELLVGTASPRRLENLPGRDFPGEAVRGFWQTAIRGGTPAGWHAEAVCWDDWLAGDSRREGALWLKAWRSPTGRALAIDLDSGDSGPFPGS